MPVRVEPGAEPIPGYKLIERLGGGGFGEVWKAEAPGGLLKAMKFVYGDLFAADEEGQRAEQEHKALRRVQQVRHSFILSLERYDIVDGQLIITTELADRTLWDRFKECRSQGLPGIPREELLGYVAETSEALDLMYDHYQLQHLDIKPQNLFLVYNHIKVADFGLVKSLEGRGAATITGGVTPVYAAPETFDGWLSRYSDQYSLAIVYMELLTGQRPFNGSSMRQLVMQHLQGQPDLTGLSAADRAAVARALQKNPEERFPTCMDLTIALRGATGQATAGVGPLPTAASPAGGKHADAILPEQVTSATVQVRGATMNPDAQNYDGDQGLTPPGHDRPHLAPPRPETEAAGGTFQDTPQSAAWKTTGRTPPAPSPIPPRLAQEKGVLQPALVVGLGRLGLQTLQQFCRCLAEEVGPEGLPCVRLLGLDTDQESLQAATHGDPREILQPQEVVPVRLHRPSHYLKARDKDGGLGSLEKWLNPKLLYRLPRQLTSAGLRPLARLAFVDQVRGLMRRFENELRALLNPEELNGVTQTPLGLRSRQPRVYVVAGLAGNTGGGMFLDVAYVLRHVLRRLGCGAAEIVGVFYLPPARPEGIRSAALANTYAALKELQYFSSGQASYAAGFSGEEGSKGFTEAGPPFQRCYVVPLPEHAPAGSAPPSSCVQAGEFLYREMATEVGAAADASRRRFDDADPLLGQTPLRSFGLYRLLWPRRLLLQRLSGVLCRRLLQRWLSKDAAPLVAEMAVLAEQQWEAMGLRAEQLIARHQETCQQRLKHLPEKLYQDVLGPILPALQATAAHPGAPLSLGPIMQALDQLEKVVGLPEDCRPQGASPPEPGPLEIALNDAAAKVADACEQSLAEWIVRLIEDPRYRLAGAEEALRQVCASLDRSAQAQETLARELNERTGQIHRRLQVLLERPLTPSSTNTSLWVGGKGKAAASQAAGAKELADLLKSFPKFRYQSLVLFHVNRLLIALRGHLTDQLREVGFCRQRLTELAKLLEDLTRKGHGEVEKTGQRLLLPAGCLNLEEAEQLYAKKISAEDLIAFDERVQGILRKEFGALVEVCLGPSQVVHKLGPALLHLAGDFLSPKLADASVTDMVLPSQASIDARQICWGQIVDCHKQAGPMIPSVQDSQEVACVGLPDDSGGERLTDLIHDALPELPLTPVVRADEIVFFREETRLQLSDLEQMGSVAQEAYRQRQAVDPGTLHTREDIPSWRPQEMVAG